MKISYKWLQEHIEEKLLAPEAVAEKLVFHAFEIESTESVGEDTVFDVKVLPDRAGDCLSHLGVAREVAGLLGLSLKKKEHLVLPSTIAAIKVELQSDLCRRYIAVAIEGVTVGPSPEWLKNKLEVIGQRSINNIVDATNFVLNDIGQPVHAFDRDMIDGGIVVRLAHENENIKLLGGEEKNLASTDLVIADYLGVLAIAGVKGGQNAEVTEATKNVIIEVANFDPISVRKTSRRLNLITDASKRFENNFSPVTALSAAEQVVALILDLAGGKVLGVSDENKTQSSNRTINFTVADIQKILGQSVNAISIEQMLKSYKYIYEKKEDEYTFTVPTWRADLIGPHDIAEEVGRFVGYDSIPVSNLPFQPTAEPNDEDLMITSVRAWCVQNGYREIYSYTFRPKGEVQVAYGAKGKDFLRSNLSEAMKESFELNRLNAPLLNLKGVKLFEIGTVFLKDKEETRVAICDQGTIQELALEDFVKEKNIVLGVSSPFYSLLSTSSFIPWSVYPFITRDLAVWVNSDEDRKKLETIVNEFSKNHCAKPAYIFDEFSKEGRTSLAYRFIFQASDRTLTDSEVSEIFSNLVNAIKAESSFEIR